MIRDINEIQTLATKYSKPQLAHMAQMGLIDPTKAVMAGMMIDRITKSNMQAPQQTVAQEALTPMPPQAPPMQQPPVAPAGIGSLPTQPEPNAGVAALPSGITEMAGGGIVAFDEGGEVPRYAEEGLVRPSMFGSMTTPNQAETQNTLRLVDEASQRPSPIGELFRSVEAGRQENLTQYNQRLESIRQKMAANTPLTPQEATLARYNNLTPASAPAEAAPPPPGTRLTNPNYVEPPAPAPAPQNKNQRQPSGPRTNRQDAGPANINQQVPPPETRVAQEEPAGIASIIPKRPDSLDIPLNLGKFTTAPLPVPGKKEIKDFLTEQDEAQKQAGVNNNIYKDLMGDLDAKKGRLASRKQEAIGTALMQTGLGLLKARKGQEAATLGEEGQKSLLGLVAANERIRETEEKIDDARRGLLVAENDYKRTRSDKALESVQKHRDKIEAMEIRNIEAQNTANSKTAEIQVQVFGKRVDLQGQETQMYGYDTQRASVADTERSRRAGAMEVAQEHSKSHLSGIELQGRNQLAVQRLQNIGINRPGETERMMAQYENIQRTQGQDAANAWLSNLERVRGAGKPQNTFSYEEAMKIVAANPANIKASPQELARQAKELVAASNPAAQPANVPPVGTIQEWDGKKWKFKGGANTKDNWEQVK